VPRMQAEAFVVAQQEILADVLDSTLATRGDLDALGRGLRSDMERVERKLIEHDGKFTLLQWMTGVLIALAVANFAKQFF
jgi:hypothetical protein